MFLPHSFSAWLPPTIQHKDRSKYPRLWTYLVIGLSHEKPASQISYINTISFQKCDRLSSLKKKCDELFRKLQSNRKVLPARVKPFLAEEAAAPAPRPSSPSSSYDKGRSRYEEKDLCKPIMIAEVTLKGRCISGRLYRR